MLRTILVTSSRTPGIDENSCSTPSICTVVMAAPCRDDNSTRRSAFPSVIPKPRSRGSATRVATLFLARPGTISSLFGLIRSCQFLCKTLATGYLAFILLIGARTPALWWRAMPAECLFCGAPALDSAALARAAAVVGDGGDIPDRCDLEPDRLERPQRRLAARARTHHFHLEHLHAVLHCLFAGVLGRHLGGIGRRLARAFKTHGAGRRPGDGVALRICDGDHGVVEGGAHVRHAGGDVLALAPARLGAAGCGLLLFGHSVRSLEGSAGATGV